MKLISLVALVLFVSCASSPHVEKWEADHKNTWTEKKETYRALSSVKEREKDSK